MILTCLDEAEKSFETQEKDKKGEFWIYVKIMTHWIFKNFYILTGKFRSKINENQ